MGTLDKEDNWAASYVTKKQPRIGNQERFDEMLQADMVDLEKAQAAAEATATHLWNAIIVPYVRGMRGVLDGTDEETLRSRFFKFIVDNSPMWAAMARDRQQIESDLADVASGKISGITGITVE
jgi:hypothetical protein